MRGFQVRSFSRFQHVSPICLFPFQIQLSLISFTQEKLKLQVNFTTACLFHASFPRSVSVWEHHRATLKPSAGALNTPILNPFCHTLWTESCADTHWLFLNLARNRSLHLSYPYRVSEVSKEDTEARKGRLPQFRKRSSSHDTLPTERTSNIWNISRTPDPYNKTGLMNTPCAFCAVRRQNIIQPLKPEWSVFPKIDSTPLRMKLKKLCRTIPEWSL